MTTSNKIVWGCYSDGGMSETQSLELRLGRPFAGARQNSNIYNAIPGSYLQYAVKDGATWCYQNINLTNQQNPEPGYTFANVTAGLYDALIQQIANNIKDDPRWTREKPLRVTFNHEPSVSIRTGIGTADEYIAAFRHVHNIFSEVGTNVGKGGNAVWCYVPTYTHLSDPTDPGTNYYTYLGIDFYNALKNGKLQYTVDQIPTILTNIYAAAAERHKDWFFGEIGVAEDNLNKAAFVARFCNSLISANGVNDSAKCKAILWSNVFGDLKDSDYHMDSSQQSLSVFQQFALNPAFN